MRFGVGLHSTFVDLAISVAVVLPAKQKGLPCHSALEDGAVLLKPFAIGVGEISLGCFWVFTEYRKGSRKYDIDEVSNYWI